MKLRILYHQNDEYSTKVENFVEECKKESSQDIDLVSLETPEGASIASIYDITDYPAILVLRDDGQLNRGWQGPNFPTIDEVIGYLNS